MKNFVFADRYAAEGLSPSGEIVASRTPPAERIVSEITDSRTLDLVRLYYGVTDLDLAWFRDEFAKEDASFSLVNNERETRVLAAAILETLVADEDELAILAVVAGSVSGHRVPAQSKGLVSSALEAMGRQSVDQRKPRIIEAKVVPTVNTKLGDEISALTADDWPALIAMLNQIRSEAQASARHTADQTSKALAELGRQMGLFREETQMLWWLVGGHSRTLGRSFAAFGQYQAAIVGAVDLGDLTSVTRLGPIAAPAMLERVIALSKRPKGAYSKDLASAIDGVAREDLNRLNIFPNVLAARIAPVTAALELARTIGPGAWHGRFLEITGLPVTIELEPTDLAAQLYREHLLGQLL